MNLDNLKKQLIEDEGCKYQVYLDSMGFPTFGIGHLLTKDDIEYQPYHALTKGGILKISPERVNQIFAQDVRNACTDCKKLFPAFDSMCDELQEILANMMFNLGYEGLKGLTSFVAAVNNKDYKLAAQRMKTFKWYRDVKARAVRLTSRMENLSQA